MSPVRSVTYVSGPDPVLMERAMGIEPTSEAWEASILPLYDARSFLTRGLLYPTPDESVQMHATFPSATRKTIAFLGIQRSSPSGQFETHPGNVALSVLSYNLWMEILRRLSRWMGSQDNMTHIVAGNTAPEFSLKSLDQKEHSLRALLERGPIVAAFFKISCPVCQFTFPFLERLHQRYGSSGATFLGISQDDARATKNFASEYGVTFPVVLDEDGYPASNAYGLTNVPTIFLIEPDGKVKVSSMGL